MTPYEATQSLMGGHGIVSTASAREICEALGISFNEQLIMRWENRDDALKRLGFVPVDDAPGEGVDMLALSYDICKQLAIEAPGQQYIGVGRQARANAQAIAQKLSIEGVL